MMTEDSCWVWIDPIGGVENPFKDYQEYLEHNGKWIIYGPKEKIGKMGSKMMQLVGSGNIIEAKFSKNPALKVPEGYDLGQDHALIVYCDDRKNSGVKEILKKELGAEEMFWKYDRDTLKEAMGKS